MTAPYYQDDLVTLYVGDCREILPTLGITADCILADPPYGETPIAWDRWPHGWLQVAAAATRSMWCFGSLRMFGEQWQDFAAAKWRLSHDAECEWIDHAAWEKHNGSGFAADRLKKVHELAGHFYRGTWGSIYKSAPREAGGSGHANVRARGPARAAHTGAIADLSYTDDGTRLIRSVIRCHNMHRHAIHPTEKPTGILEPLVRYACPPGGLVVDPFAGSASTLDAARMTGRRAIGIEVSEEYAERAVRRLSQLTLEAS